MASGTLTFTGFTGPGTELTAVEIENVWRYDIDLRALTLTVYYDDDTMGPRVVCFDYADSATLTAAVVAAVTTDVEVAN